MKKSFFPESLEYRAEDRGDEHRRPKVFQVLAGGPWGGGAVVVLAITRALMQIGCQVWVLCLDDVVAQRFAQAGAQVVRCNVWRREINPLHDLLSLGRLYWLCRRERFDLVVTHTSKGGFLGRIAARLAGVPRVIHTAHGFAWHGFTSAATTLFQIASPALRFYVTLERIAAHFCDLIISVNHEDRLDAVKRGVVPPEKIVTVLNGIDMARFSVVRSPGLRQQLAKEREGFVIGAVGRLAPQKGFEYLIQAMPDVLSHYPDCRLVLVGEGPLEAQLKTLAHSLKVADRCEFLGFRSDIPALLACFDVFAQPSRWEGLSITLLEAMAAARPIVATDIKGNRELVAHGVDGLLAASADSQALANAIIELLQDRKRAETMGARAREKVGQHFSQAAMIENTLRWYGLKLDGQAAQAYQASLSATLPEPAAGHPVYEK